MISLDCAKPGRHLSVLALGAHSDDIEIGAGATLLQWIATGVTLDVTWCVLSAEGRRGFEARASADAFLRGAASARVELAEFRDSFFPFQGDVIKDWLRRLAETVSPDVVLTHRANDAHQDHRVVNQLTFNHFRDHLILEYEIPKWDGDLGQPNLYVPVAASALSRKVELLMEHFGTQRSKDWFDPETFSGLARLRGLECRAPERYAEAFVLRKGVLGASR